MSIPVLPESAPFTPAQRAWLNGFFAGMLGLDQSAANGAALNGAALNGHAAPAPEAEEEFPWHDSTMPMDERMQLAEGKPLSRQFMAAMAQLDCGSCGYLCQTYAEAIAGGTDKDLTKCVPGGKDTAKKLKELMAQGGASNGATSNGAALQPAHIERNGAAERAAAPRALYDRHNPYPARILEIAPLNHPGSEKDVRFVSLDLNGSGLTYEVGDSLGVYPENCEELVESILEVLRATGEEPVLTPDGFTVPARVALAKAYVVNRISEEFVRHLAHVAADPAEASRLAELAEDDAENFLDGRDILDLLWLFPSTAPTSREAIGELIATLPPLQPRLYSISSSLKAHPGQVHLTVGVVRYSGAESERLRKGVASTFLTERMQPGHKVGVFVQHSHGFRPPADPDTPIIMVGPGTGIAPFRAFLQERHATGAPGRNWLLFGDQHRAHDFLYEREMQGYLSDGLLTRLDIAFSRDQAEKIYVQHRMKEHAAQMWSWLADGAHFYVCGDAQRMARDVDATLRNIVAEHGQMSPDDAKSYVATLARSGRYQRDVY